MLGVIDCAGSLEHLGTVPGGDCILSLQHWHLIIRWLISKTFTDDGKCPPISSSIRIVGKGVSPLAKHQQAVAKTRNTAFRYHASVSKFLQWRRKSWTMGIGRLSISANTGFYTSILDHHQLHEYTSEILFAP